MHLDDLLQSINVRKLAPLFENSKEVAQETYIQCYEIVNQLCWEYNVEFVERKFIGYYACDPKTSTVYGLFPIRHTELYLAMFFFARCILGDCSTEDAIRWITLQNERSVSPVERWPDIGATVLGLIQNGIQ